MTISFDTTQSCGVHTLRNFSAQPDENGVILAATLDVPAWKCGVYHAAFQKYDPMSEGKSGAWPNGTNRVQPLRIETFRDLTRGGFFLLLQLENGDHLALLPLSGQESIAGLASQGDELQVLLATQGSAAAAGDFPLFAWARERDPYLACRRVWESAIEALGAPARMREAKAYPEIFNYLGWCSWEQFRFAISEEILLDALKNIENSGLPIRFFLVDDGHLDTDKTRPMRLHSFAADTEKFPNGWKALLAARKPDKIRWMGLWLNFNGYWQGISPENGLGDLNSQLMPMRSGALQPRDDFGSAFAFYDAMIGAAHVAGFDFIKVDNQAGGISHYNGGKNPARAASCNARALETASARHMDGLINCMAHGPSCVFNTRISNVTRCSEDYLNGDAGRARRHLHNSYGNIPWLGQTVWGDHDMFHSNDPVCGAMMARSKAMSGGPIYLSDDPAHFVAANIWPLCLEDGRLLRPLAPAAPLPRSLMCDPFAEAAPYYAIAPLAGGAAAIVAYNLTEPLVPLEGTISARDYEQAACMFSPWAPWQVPGEGVLLYDWQRQTAHPLREDFGFSLPAFEDLLVLLCPIRCGWAAIGRADKFLSPAAIEVLDASEPELLIRMSESGPLTIWSERGAVSANQTAGESADGALWRFDFPLGERDFVVRLRRF